MSVLVRKVVFWGMMVCLLTAVSITIVSAQDEEPAPTPEPSDNLIPLVHVVAEGENLTYIAELHGTTVEEILLLNGLDAESVLYVGQELVIPGGTGEAIATVYTTQLGDNLRSVAANFNTTVTDVAVANRLMRPDYTLLPGQSLTLISRTGSALPNGVTGKPHIVRPNESLLMVAAQYGVSVETLAEMNGLSLPAYVLAGQRLRVPSEAEYRFLTGEWVDVQIRPFPITPGQTVTIYVENLLAGTPTGQFAGQQLRFFPTEDGFTALIGLDAFTEAGLYELSLGGSGIQPWRPMTQQLPVTQGNYGTQFITLGEEYNALLDPTVRQEEDAFLATYFNHYSEAQQWQGVFQTPISVTVVTAVYGDGRSYNGGPIEIFHTGVDYGGAVGTPILAPANGTVIFAEETQLRGLVTIVDHGLGVTTAYFHQSEMLVQVGDLVVVGQPIGTLGSTGLSSGPHLHWDLRVNNVPVDGVQWLNEVFP